MTTVVIPTRTDLASYAMQVDLAGETFALTFRWNARASTWFMDVADGAGEVLAVGVAVVIGWPLLRLVQDHRAPKGVLLALDTAGRDEPPGLADLGARVLLTFQAAA